jgi:arylsulfatase A-like enzyme
MPGKKWRPPADGTDCFAINGYSLIDDSEIAQDQLDAISANTKFEPDGKVKTEGQGKYMTDLLGDKAVAHISDHDTSRPLFLYFAITAPHAPIDSGPYHHESCSQVAELPASVIPHGRETICNMMYGLDVQVGRIVEALKAKNMYENSIIFYSSDNGGMPTLGNSNGMFRGQKGSFLEGGVRVPAFVSGGLVRGDMRESSSLIHITDVFATIIRLAGRYLLLIKSWVILRASANYYL